MFTAPVAHMKQASASAYWPTTANELRLEAKTGVTFDGSNLLTQWADGSGHARNYAPPGSGKPTYVASALNGKPGIRALNAGGAVEWLTCAGWWDDTTGPSEFELWMVLKSSRAGGTTNFGHAGFGNDSGSNGTNYPASDDTIYETAGRDHYIQSSSAGSLTRSPHIYRVQGKAGAGGYYKMTVGGSLVVNSVTAYTKKWVRGSGFYSLFSYEGTFKFLGDIYIVGLWSAALSAADATGLTLYVQADYGAAVT